MSTSILALAHNWAFAIFLIGTIGLCAFMLVAGHFLGSRAKARTKHVPYEFSLSSMLKPCSYLHGQLPSAKPVG